MGKQAAICYSRLTIYCYPAFVRFIQFVFKEFRIVKDVDIKIWYIDPAVPSIPSTKDITA